MPRHHSFRAARASCAFQGQDRFGPVCQRRPIPDPLALQGQYWAVADTLALKAGFVWPWCPRDCSSVRVSPETDSSGPACGPQGQNRSGLVAPKAKSPRACRPDAKAGTTTTRAPASASARRGPRSPHACAVAPRDERRGPPRERGLALQEGRGVAAAPLQPRCATSIPPARPDAQAAGNFRKYRARNEKPR